MFAFNLPTFSRASRTAVNAAKNSARVALNKTYAPTASKVQLRGVITSGAIASRSLRADRHGVNQLTNSRTQPILRPNRHYATTTDGDNANEPTNKEGEENKAPWIEVLESVANGPWLENTIPDEKLRLSIAHGLIYQMLLYLSRPIGSVHFDAESPSEAHAQYLSAFETARVPDTSEMGRARIASAKLIKAVVHQTNSISPSSPIRKDNEEVFKIVEALTAVTDAHLTNNDGVVEDWKQFWSHAQPVLVGLAQELTEKGFVLQEPEAEGAGEGQ